MTETELYKKYIQTANGKIYYFTNDLKSNLPTVVLLHGLSANHTTWSKTIKVLANNQFNCIAPDLRGHGYSDKTKKPRLYSINNQANDLSFILKQEKIKSYVLVGYSYGGLVALQQAIGAPEHLVGLVLASSNHTSPARYKGLGWMNGLIIASYYLAAFLMLWQSKKEYYYYRPSRAKNYWQATWQGLQTMPASVNGWLLAKLLKADFREQLGSIKVPTCLVYSRIDPFVTKQEIEDMAVKLPICQVVESEHDSHFIATDSQVELTGIILNFLKNSCA